MASEGEGRCLYEVLGLTNDATADEIRLAYRKLALQRHPDKLVHSGISEAEATAQFQQLINAYEVLSNPEERAWYDSHRSQILFSDPTSSTGSVPNLFSFFSNYVYSGYDDTRKGFYKVYSEIFDKIYATEVNFAKKLGLRLGSVKEAPVMGNLESPYSQVTAFYGYWIGFSTVMDFAWVDEYDTRAGPNRKSRRLMDEENRKLRKKAKREYNETVRGLAKFVKRRDKRVIDMQMKKSLEEEKRKEEEKMRKWEELEKGRSERERARAKVEPETVEDDGSDDNWEFDDEDSGGRTEEMEEFYCVLCKKKFRSEKQWKNHEKSRKHKERVAEFRESVKGEDQRYGDAEAGIRCNRDQSEAELQDQFEDGLELKEDDEIDDGGVQDQSSDDEEEFVVSGNNSAHAVLGSDDEMSVLEAMVAGHKDRKNRKAASSVWEQPESSVTEGPVDINIEEMMDFMEYDNRKSSRKRRGKRDKDKKSDGEEAVPVKPGSSSTGDKGGGQDDDQNNGFDDASHIHDSSNYSVLENETDDGKEDHHEETNKIPKLPASRKVTPKGETERKPKESNKVRKAKAAQRKAMGNKCETCGVDFESRNKLHKHLGDTGHAILGAR